MDTNESIVSSLQAIRRRANLNPPLPTPFQIEQIQKAKSGGYPADLYHAKLAPIQVLNAGEEEEMSARGFSRRYVPKTHPKYIFRRSWDTKHSGIKNEVVNGQLVEVPIPHMNQRVEERLVNTAAEEAKLKADPIPSGYGPWVDSLAEIEAIKESAVEPVSMKLARLEEQMNALAAAKAEAEAEAQSEEPKKRGPGRPPKVHEPEE